jgi:hypothetical protein
MRFQGTKLILGRGESGLLRKNGHMVLKFKGNMRNMAPNARGVDDQRSGITPPSSFGDPLKSKGAFS